MSCEYGVMGCYKEGPHQHEEDRLREEIARVKAGRFTAEEIHNVCHNLHGTVNAAAFACGCTEEQRKLYGCAPDADEVTRLKAELAQAQLAKEALREQLLEECDIVETMKTQLESAREALQNKDRLLARIWQVTADDIVETLVSEHLGSECLTKLLNELVRGS